jgi:hypothetical protein
MNEQQRAVVQQALEALEYYDSDDDTPTTASGAIYALRQLLEQPVQEPVTWGVHDQIALTKAIQSASPAQPAAWVGLTDEERQEIWKGCDPQHAGYVTALVEVKLREKNGGA